MQVSRDWSPPGGALGRILSDTRRRLATIEKARPEASRTPSAGSAVAHRPSLAEALRGTGDRVAIIAEIKRRSPSRGVLNETLDAAAQAAMLESGGASAISVLTEPEHFGGSDADLAAVRSAVAVPVLRKDFHVTAPQVQAAASTGAAAILLIARALSPDELPELMRVAGQEGLECLVEVRTEWELERALDAGAAIIGVNSRNLETLEVDDAVPARLVPRIPRSVVAVWESGIQSPNDVAQAAAAGADAVLVGSALSRSANPGRLVSELAAVRREPGARHG